MAADWGEAQSLSLQLEEVVAALRTAYEEMDSAEDELDELDSWESEFDDLCGILRKVRSSIMRTAPEAMANFPDPVEATVSRLSRLPAHSSSLHTISAATITDSHTCTGTLASAPASQALRSSAHTRTPASHHLDTCSGSLSPSPGHAPTVTPCHHVPGTSS